jgi:uncharacterized protein YuzE
MYITYSESGDMLMIHLQKYEGRFSHSQHVKNDSGGYQAVIDLATDGEILGIELFDAAKKFGKDEMYKKADRVIDV